MNEILLFIHFFGLMLGAAGGFGSAVLMRRALTLPAEEAKVLRAVGPILARVSAVGLVLLWVTGVILVWSKWDGLGSLPSLFWVKFVFVVLLTIFAGLTDMTYAQVKRGNVAAAARLPRLGPLAGASSLLAVLFAVLAFN
jgi:hypothetical protein